jgi:hypothetical protein
MREVGIVILLGLAGAAFVATTLRGAAAAGVGGGAPPQAPWPSPNWPDPSSQGVLAANGWMGPGITIPPQLGTDDTSWKFPPAPLRA